MAPNKNLPTSPMITSTKQGKLAAKLDSILTEVTSTNGKRTPAINAVIAGVTNQRETIYHQAKGVRNIDTGEPVSLTHQFAYYSCTKSFTAMAILKLYEEGKINLDLPARTYLPLISTIGLIDPGTVNDEDGTFTVEPRRPQNEVTVRHLLLNTAGFAYAFLSMDYLYLTTKRDVHISLLQPTRELFSTNKMPLIHEPGTEWTYGHSSDWLGLIVEEVSGQKLGEYVKKIIFDPIGMNSCTFHLKDDSNMINTHRRLSDGSIKVTSKYGVHLDPKIDLGGQGCFGTVGDYLKFLRVYLNEGVSPDTGNRILEEQTMKYALQNHLPPSLEAEFPGMTPNPDLIADYIADGFSLTGHGYGKNVLPTGRPKGVFYWGGLANLFYWFDLENKVAGFWAEQMFPYMDEFSLKSYGRFEQAVYDTIKPEGSKL